MELKEYLAIIKKYKRLFWGVVLLVMAITFSYLYLQPKRYDTSLTLNITRLGSQRTEQYQFDDFYRLQADEKFAETVVYWLKSPRVVADIYKSAAIDVTNLNLRQLSRLLQAEKLSSQLISLKFSAAEKESAEKIAAAITKSLEENTATLNKDQQENTWFKIIAHEPIILPYSPSIVVVFFGSLFGGMFLAFWMVLVRHYLE